MKCLIVVALLAFGIAPSARAEIEITPVISAGGIAAWLYEDHTIPMLNVEASFLGGSVLDPEGREGAVRLMAALLEEGAGELDATAFSEARDDLAAELQFDSGLDSVTISAQMLTENRDASLALLRTAMVEPRFDPEAVARVQGQLLSIVRSDATDPDAIAGRTFYAKAFPGHPYSRPRGGTLESVAGLDVEAVRAAHAATLVRDRLTIAVVGDITANELGPLLDTLFGDLPESGPPLPSVAIPNLPGTLSVVDLDIPQSVVLFGQPGIARDDPDFIPAYVLDHILGGGGFGSRLTEEVREKRGLTYGISTWLAPNDFGWLYMGGFSTANARAAEALDIVRAEWQRMHADGVTGAELAAAKQYLTGAFPLRFDGNGRIASQLLYLQLSGLDVDYVNERNALVEAVTIEDANRVAASMLDPQRLTFVVVGRPEGVGASN